MATVALSTLRTTLQELYLRDSKAAKWTASQLDICLNMAITQWTTDVPIASSQEYTMVASQHAYALPGNATCVYSVYGYFESSANAEFLAPMQVQPGMWVEDNEPRRYIVGFPTGTQFYLPRLPISDTKFTLYYGAIHNKLENDGDLLDLRVHRWGEQAVLAYAAYLAYLPYAASRARRRQWLRRPDVDTGNPPDDQADAWLERYNELVSQYATPAIWQLVELERC